MQIVVISHWLIEFEPLPGPSAVICMADSVEQLAVIRDESNVVARLNLVFNDAGEDFHLIRKPTLEDAQKILQFARQHCHVPNLVLQCQVGVGRSQAVQAALLKIFGDCPRSILHNGTYNRSLYRLMLEAAQIPHEREPLVSITVRVKYPSDRLKLFLLSMQRQRHENWEVVAVTDGPDPAAACVVNEMQDPRIRLIETEKPMGRWGHPYRQRGLDACRGEFIGMSNDDNYYVPGYLEQMLFALEDADLATCLMLHNYHGWHVAMGSDIGCWIARASLVRQVPWTGLSFKSDEDYLLSLKALAGDRVAALERALFVHN